MKDEAGTPNTFVQLDRILIGERSSRLSSAIFFLLCLLPAFGTIVFGAVDLATWVIIALMTTAIGVLWLIDGWRGKGYLVNLSPIQIPLGGWICLGAIQLVPFFGRAISLEPYATRLFEGRLIVFAFFFCACLTFINRERRLRVVVWFVVIFGAIIGFFAVLQRLAELDSIYGLRRSAQSIPFGPFVNQHHFGGFMALTAGPALALLFGGGLGRDRRLLLIFSVVIMGIAVVLTGSRGALLAFIATTSFVAIASFAYGRSGSRSEDGKGFRPARFLWVGASIIGLLLLIFGSVLLLGGNDSLFRSTLEANLAEDVSNGRYHFWQAALRIFSEHPIWGAGFDAFGVAFTKFDTWSGRFRVEQAHNEYLQTLADAGITGFALLIGFLWMLFRSGLRAIGDAGDGFVRKAVIGALGGCFGIAIHSFFDFPLRTYSNAFFFLLLAACATVQLHEVSGEKPRRRRRRSSAL